MSIVIWLLIISNMIEYKKGCIKKINSGRLHITKKGDFNDLIFTFDVEASSGFIINENVEPFDFSKNKDFYKDFEKVSLVYIWQASIEDTVYYGRKLEDFKIFLDELQEKYNGILTIWVHNLAYEFQWLLNIIKFDKIFARSPHKVIYADYENIRFRCSYFLTRLSLEKWAIEKKLPVKKLVGNIDYISIKTPNTELTQADYDYSENDCLVVYHGIKQYIETYGHIDSIPLTQTGEVRQALKNKFNGNFKHYEKCTDLLPRNASEYALAMAILSGGYTHANYIHSGDIIKNVYGDDEASEYPYVMCAKKFPMTKWYDCTKNYENYLHDNNYSTILDITFYNIEAKTFNNYISLSKCYATKDVVTDNGRVSYANELSIVITGIDYNIIDKTYKFTKKINKAWQSGNGYLPKEIIEFILDSYGDKTTLKGIDEHYALYMYKKQMLNSVFGMMITAIIQANIEFDGIAEWKEEFLSPEILDKKLIELKNKKWKNWLSFWWGCFVTAYARQDLWNVISEIDRDVIYCDTDSTYHINSHDDLFNALNLQKDEEIKKMCDFYNIDFNLTRPLDIKGQTHPLGHWERDEADNKGICYSEFVTLGAKRYCYRKAKTKELKITVAGVNKKKGVKALKDDIKNFHDGLIFDYETSGKLTMSYLSDMPKIIWNKGHKDEYISELKFGIHTMPSTYSMDLTDLYADAINIIAELKENFKDFSSEEIHKLIYEKRGNK